MKPLDKVIQNVGVWHHQNTNDAQVYFIALYHKGVAVSILSLCLQDGKVWMEENE